MTRRARARFKTPPVAQQPYGRAIPLAGTAVHAGGRWVFSRQGQLPHIASPYPESERVAYVSRADRQRIAKEPPVVVGGLKDKMRRRRAKK